MSKHLSRDTPRRGARAVGGARIAGRTGANRTPRLLLTGAVALSLACSMLAFLTPGVFASAWNVVTPAEKAPAATVAADSDLPAMKSVDVGPTATPSSTPSGEPSASALASARAGEAPALVPDATRLSRKAQTAASSRRALVAATPLKVKLLTFNVLGSSHTTAGGDKPTYGAGTQRANWAAEVVRGYAPDLLGTQETEFDQLNVLQAQLPGYTFFPGDSSDQASVRTNLAWNNAKFSMVSSGYITVKFVGLTRTDPYVQLKDKATGRLFWFMNVHNSPNRGAAGTFESERRAQLTAEVNKVNELAKSAPVFLIGDFNDHNYTYCRLTGSTALRAAQGGGVNPCTLPSWHRIDWIFGAGVSSWADARQERGPLVSRATDHYVLSATATLG